MIAYVFEFKGSINMTCRDCRLAVFSAEGSRICLASPSIRCQADSRPELCPLMLKEEYLEVGGL